MKKGFTLIELIAVIAIIGVLATIAIPSVIRIFDNKKQQLYDNTIKELERVAKNYMINNPDRYDEVDTSGYIDLSISTLCTDKYIECPLLDPRNSDEITGYVRVRSSGEDYQYAYMRESSDEPYIIKLTVTKNGGDSTQVFNEEYTEGTSLTLENLTKTGFDFLDWIVVKGNSTISNNVLVFGNTDTEIYARWKSSPKLIMDPNGGENSQTFEEYYSTGTVITLEQPTKTGYVFAGWDKVKGDSIISGNSLTIGNDDSTFRARWTVGTYEITLINTSATTNGSTSVEAVYDGNIGSITNPQRTYIVTYSAGSSGASLSKASDTVTYTFDGWYTEETGGVKVINVDGTLVSNVSGYTDNNGKWKRVDSTTLYAHWTGDGSVTTAQITRAGYTCNFGTVGNHVSYTPTASITLTAQCNANSYTCDAGKYLKAGETTCSSCPAGSYCTGGELTYSDSSDVGKTACQAGKYTDTTGKSSCTSCAIGSYAEGTGNTGCTACANGKTTSSTGATSSSSCSNCSSITGLATWASQSWNSNNNTIANLCTAATCNEGYYLNSGSCTVCQAGTTTSAGNSSTSCSACSNNTGVASWSSGCTAASCSTGYQLSNGSCTACGVAHATAYSSGCTPSACESGYVVSGSSCVVATPTITISPNSNTHCNSGCDITITVSPTSLSYSTLQYWTKFQSSGGSCGLNGLSFTNGQTFRLASRKNGTGNCYVHVRACTTSGVCAEADSGTFYMQYPS